MVIVPQPGKGVMGRKGRNLFSHFVCNLHTVSYSRWPIHTLGESRGALQLKEYEWKGTADIQPLMTSSDPIQGQICASYKYDRASSSVSWLSSL